MGIDVKCYKCGCADKTMASIYSAGLYYMCNDCIIKEEAETGKTAVFFNIGGLKFMSNQDLKELKKKNNQQFHINSASLCK